MRSSPRLQRTYERWRVSSLGARTEAIEHALIFDLLGSVTGCRLLDVGCGDGTLTAAFANAGAEVLGIDRCPSIVERAIIVAPDADFVIADVQSLPFPDAHFDVVVVNTVLCLVEDRRAAVAEAMRVLRPGGRLVLGELGRWSLWALKRRIKGIFGSEMWRRSRFSDARSLTAELVDAGLRVHVVRAAIFYPPFGWAARLMASIDPCLGRYTTIGAAYLAVAATKPYSSGMDRDDH